MTMYERRLKLNHHISEWRLRLKGATIDLMSHYGPETDVVILTIWFEHVP